MENSYGYATSVWESARTEAREAMIEVARRHGLLTYSELTDRIRAIRFHPRDINLFHLLGQVSTSEFEAGRGMLTAVVVNADEGAPGSGFFRLARSLGQDFSDELAFWATQVSKVYEAWTAT